MGLEPTNAGATIQCVNPFATTAMTMSNGYAEIIIYQIFSCLANCNFLHPILDFNGKNILYLLDSNYQIIAPLFDTT